MNAWGEVLKWYLYNKNKRLIHYFFLKVMKMINNKNQYITIQIHIFLLFHICKNNCKKLATFCFKFY